MRNTALSLLALLLSATGLAAGRDVTAPTYGSTSLPMTSPSVATVGDRFVTVWSAGGHLYESVADHDGNVLTPLAVPVAGGGPCSPQIAALGDHYIVLTCIDDKPELLSLSSDGTLLGAQPKPSLRFAGQIVVSGDEFLISESVGIYSPLAAHVLRSDGSIVKSDIAVAKSLTASAVTATATGWLVVTVEPPKMVAQRIGRDGSIQTRSVASVLQRVDRIAIASDGDEAVLLWLENVFGTGVSQRLWSAVVSADGQIGTPKQLVLPDGPILSTVLLRWTGNHYLAVISGQQSFAFRLDTEGAAIDSPMLIGDAVDAFATLGNRTYAAGRRFSLSNFTGPNQPIIGASFAFDPVIGEVHAGVISVGLR